MQTRRVLFYITEGVHLLDLSGMVQVFYEAVENGAAYQLLFVSHKTMQRSAVALPFAELQPVEGLELQSNDIVVVAGFELAVYEGRDHSVLLGFLQQAAAAGCTICSVCTAAFALGEAGLLNGRACTTHWKYTAALQQRFPLADVKKDCLFTVSGPIYTSAGISTGIDLALYLMEQWHGAHFAYQLARELVVYIRRDGPQSQQSVYLQYRQHLNHRIHELQDWIIHHLDSDLHIETLAARVHMSPRNLTRLFKTVTGVTIATYIEKLRVDKALNLLKNDSKLEAAARACGLRSAEGLRRLIRRHTGHLPSSAS